MKWEVHNLHLTVPCLCWTCRLHDKWLVRLLVPLAICLYVLYYLFKQLIIRPAAARVSSDIKPKWHTTLDFCIHQSTTFMARPIAYNKPLWIESSIPLVLSRLLQSVTSS